MAIPRNGLANALNLMQLTMKPKRNLINTITSGFLSEEYSIGGERYLQDSSKFVQYNESTHKSRSVKRTSPLNWLST